MGRGFAVRPYGATVVALLLVAVSVGLDNFAACTALGVSGVDRGLRLRVALIFGLFEGAMPVLGLLLGHSLAAVFGSAVTPVAGAMLGIAGAYAIVTGLRHDGGVATNPKLGFRQLVPIAVALSIDNLVIGFALGTYHVNLVVAAVTIAVVSVTLSLLGLELGGQLGDRLGKWSEVVGGAILVLVGVAIGTGVL